MARRAAGGSPRLRERFESATIVLCIRFDSGYLTRKWCQCPPRTNDADAARCLGPSSSSSVVRSRWAAGGLGQVRAMQRLVTKSADQEVPVVDERVLHTGLSEVGRELRLPHALGEPQPRGPNAEAAFEVLAHARDLLEAVGAGERGEDRLIESREEELGPAIGGEPADQIEPRH